MQGESVILRTVMVYAQLKTVKRFLGPKHPDVLQRAAKVVTKFLRNFSGMAHVFRRVLPEVYEVPLDTTLPLLRKTWYLPRNFVFNYPREFAGRWHSPPPSSWKRNIMRRYCTEEQLSRPLSRYELFCIQKKMYEEDILNMGW